MAWIPQGIHSVFSVIIKFIVSVLLIGISTYALIKLFLYRIPYLRKKTTKTIFRPHLNGTQCSFLPWEAPFVAPPFSRKQPDQHNYPFPFFHWDGRNELIVWNLMQTSYAPQIEKLHPLCRLGTNNLELSLHLFLAWLHPEHSCLWVKNYTKHLRLFWYFPNFS